MATRSISLLSRRVRLEAGRRIAGDNPRSRLLPVDIAVQNQLLRSRRRHFNFDAFSASRAVRDMQTPGLSRKTFSVRDFNSESDFHSTSDESLESIQDAVDDCFDDQAGIEYECTFASGVLTLSLPPHGTWVLNKQTPNQQIWWSSPLSGPKRFEYLDGSWCSTKDGLLLAPLLSQELSHVLHLPEDALVIDV